MNYRTLALEKKLTKIFSLVSNLIILSFAYILQRFAHSSAGIKLVCWRRELPDNWHI